MKTGTTVKKQGLHHIKWVKIQVIATENTEVLSACRYTAPAKHANDGV